MDGLRRRRGQLRQYFVRGVVCRPDRHSQQHAYTDCTLTCTSLCNHASTYIDTCKDTQRACIRTHIQTHIKTSVSICVRLEIPAMHAQNTYRRIAKQTHSMHAYAYGRSNYLVDSLQQRYLVHFKRGNETQFKSRVRPKSSRHSRNQGHFFSVRHFKHSRQSWQTQVGTYVSSSFQLFGNPAVSAQGSSLLVFIVIKMQVTLTMCNETKFNMTDQVS